MYVQYVQVSYHIEYCVCDIMRFATVMGCTQILLIAGRVERDNGDFSRSPNENEEKKITLPKQSNRDIYFFSTRLNILKPYTSKKKKCNVF